MSTSLNTLFDPGLEPERRVELLHEGLLALVESLDAQQIGNIFQAVDAFVAGLAERTSPKVSLLDSIVEEAIAFDSAPLKNGYEMRLANMGYAPIRAKIAARYIVKCGEEFARVYNDVRGKAGALIPQLARCSEDDSLKISRRAQKLNELLILDEKAGLIEPVIETHLSLTRGELVEIADLAAKRDQLGCSRLVEIAKVLILRLPSSRGSRLSIKTATHIFYLTETESLGRPPGFSWNPNDKEFSDPITKATQEQLADPDFDPRYAVMFYKKKKLTDVHLKEARVRRQQLAANARPTEKHLHS